MATTIMMFTTDESAADAFKTFAAMYGSVTPTEAPKPKRKRASKAKDTPAKTDTPAETTPTVAGDVEETPAATVETTPPAKADKPKAKGGFRRRKPTGDAEYWDIGEPSEKNGHKPAALLLCSVETAGGKEMAVAIVEENVAEGKVRLASISGPGETGYDNPKHNFGRLAVTEINWWIEDSKINDPMDATVENARTMYRLFDENDKSDK